MAHSQPSITDAQQKPRFNLEQWLRGFFKGFLDRIAGVLLRLGISPNAVTLFGVLGNLAAAILLGLGHMLAGGLVILVIWPIDALDGSMARLKGAETKFGAFYDSVTDRYSELLIFGGLLYYFLVQDNILASMLTYLAAAGSVLVSYTRARAEAVGVSAKVGMLSRVERYLVLVPCLLFNIPMVALWIMAVLTNFTALQRIYHVARSTHTLK